MLGQMALEKLKCFTGGLDITSVKQTYLMLGQMALALAQLLQGDLTSLR